LSQELSLFSKPVVPFAGRRRFMVRREKTKWGSLDIGICYLVLFFVAGFVSPAMAQEAEDRVKVGEVVVTASRVEEPRKETTSSVVVITGEEIEKMNVQFVPDVLRRVTDLNLVQNGGEGKSTRIFLRGGSPNQTMVMLDGVKVKSTTLGQFDFAGLSVEDIERIEIVKGPQSTMYGSEAMAGVVNIITKKGRGKLRMMISQEYGSYNTYKTAGSVSGGSDAYDYRLSASYYNTDGISAAKDGSEDDGYENKTVSGKLGATLKENLAVEVTGKYWDDENDLDYGTTRDDPNHESEGERYLVAGKGAVFLVDQWEQILMVSRYSEELKERDPDALGFLNSDIISTLDTIGWQHNVYPHESYVATVGGEYRNERGENKGKFDEDIDNYAAYFNTKIKHEGLTLSGGVRYDDYETFGDEVTYRVAALDEPVEGTRFRASYATGFRAPTFKELFSPGFGNPNLKPEESYSWEVGMEQDYSDTLTVSVIYFEQHYDDLIDVIPAGTAVNIAEARVRGVESSVIVRPVAPLTLTAFYTYLDAKDEEAGGRLNLRPRDKFSAAADYASGALSLHADYLYVGKRKDVAAGRDLFAYNVVNLSGSYTWRFLAVFGRVQNVLDEDYEEAGGFGTPGVSAFGGVRLIF
jgi:vitamin B12 transporter